MTILWILGGLVLIVLGTLFVVGAVLPRDHVATASLVVRESAGAVWERVRRVEQLPTWRPSIQRVEVREGPADAPMAWTEHAKRDALKLSVVREETARLVETKIDDAGMPFGGAWTFELAPVAEGTRVTITERGFIKVPPFRVIARFVLGYHGSIRAYLTDLGQAAGAAGEITIER